MLKKKSRLFILRRPHLPHLYWRSCPPIGLQPAFRQQLHRLKKGIGITGAALSPTCLHPPRADAKFLPEFIAEVLKGGITGFVGYFRDSFVPAKDQPPRKGKPVIFEVAEYSVTEHRFEARFKFEFVEPRTPRQSGERRRLLYVGQQ